MQTKAIYAIYVSFTSLQLGVEPGGRLQTKQEIQLLRAISQLAQCARPLQPIIQYASNMYSLRPTSLVANRESSKHWLISPSAFIPFLEGKDNIHYRAKGW
jgi:hypothetical protein